MMGMMGGFGNFFGVSLFGFLFMLLFWGLVIVGIVYLLRVLFEQSSRSEKRAYPDKPLEILKGRYARGEITKEEYDLMRQDLI